ncbi:MAG TPA: tetratricopeptide repeat protein [Candidatus Edwardsbacteria bacterium]|nr:tetratricopeptide repeat protein [Candidatus Edwardsbacteria bacterium]
MLWLSAPGESGGGYYPHQLLQRKAEVLDIVGDWNQAESIHRRALELAAVNADERLQAGAQALLAGVLFKKGRYAETSDLLARAQAYYQRIGDQRAAGRVLGEIGNVHRVLGDYDRAMEFYQRHLAIAEALDDRQAISQTVGNMGNVYRVRGQHAPALECYEREVQLSERLGDRQAAALATGNIGLVSLNQGDYRRALEYTKKFLQSALSLGDKRNQGVAYGVLGNILRQQHRLDDAMAAFRRQLEIMSELGDIRSKTYALGNIGRTYQRQYNYPMAMEYYRRHLALAEQLGDKRSISFAEAALAGLYHVLIAYPKAWAHYDRAIRLCRELQLKPELADNLSQTAELFLQQGDHGRAAALNEEALAVAGETGAPALAFRCRLLAARIASQRDPQGAAARMRALLEGPLKPDQRAEACYHLFRLTGDEDCRRQAQQACRAVLAETPDLATKLRLEELS